MNLSNLLMTCYDRAQQRFMPDEDADEAAQNAMITIMRKLPGHQGTRDMPALTPYAPRRGDFAAMAATVARTEYLMIKRRDLCQDIDPSGHRTYGTSAKKPSLSDYDGVDE